MRQVNLWQFIDPVGLWVCVGSVTLDEFNYEKTACIDVPVILPNLPENEIVPVSFVKYYRMKKVNDPDIFVNYTNTFVCK